MAMQIELRNLKLFGSHGLHPEESFTGNEFGVEVIMELGSEPSSKYTLDESIDYSLAFSIIKEEFEVKEPLLENLALRIAEALKSRFPLLGKIEISIHKLNPPIPHFRGTVGIRYSREFK